MSFKVKTEDSKQTRLHDLTSWSTYDLNEVTVGTKEGSGRKLGLLITKDKVRLGSGAVLLHKGIVLNTESLALVTRVNERVTRVMEVIQD